MSEMTPTRFAKIRAIYLATERLPAQERDSYLIRACGDDTALLEEVQALLAVDEPTEASMRDAIAGVAKTLASSHDDETQPAMIGSYRVIDSLGRGGMGRVFLAERADGHFEQLVAVKLVDRSRLTQELVTRFRSERQILASLDHPNIGRLYDGGETEDGLPYLVMEYVDGVPVDRYCDEHALTIGERLAVFRQICSAVEYAHRNLVVHRDIKPSNILVGRDGTPKLLDFGIAKLLSRESIDYTMAVTVADMRLMTPRNASPEQVRGEAITTATDIYALGLLLYELLTGRFPYHATTAGYDLEQQICESTPTRPSTVVTRSPGDDTSEDARAISQARRLPTTDQLRKQLKGDLDNIVLVSMRKEPERRYATVRQLSDDVQHYLDHRPVRARGDSFGYRAEKFLRRNSGGVALTALSTLVVAGLIASYTHRLGIERDRAELEAAKAFEVASFMTSLFKEADPRQRGSEPVTVVDMLNRGSERVASDLAQQPALQASLAATIAESYQNMWEVERARDYLENSLPPLEDRLGIEHPDVMKMRRSLGIAASILGEYEQGLTLHQENFEILAKLHGRQSREAATELQQIAIIQSNLGEFQLAEEKFIAVIDVFRRLGSDGQQALSTGLMEYGSMLRRVGRMEDDAAAHTEALEIRRRLHGEEHPDYVAVLNNLANGYNSRSMYPEAAALMRENVRLNRAIYGDLAIPYGVALANFANVTQNLDDLEGALELNLQALPILASGYGENHARVAFLNENIAYTYQQLGEYGSAEQHYAVAIRILSEVFGSKHLEVAITRSRLGSLLVELDRFAEAETHLQQAVATMSDEFGETHNRTTFARQQLGKALHGLGQTDAAIEVVQIGIDAVSPVPDHLRGNKMSLLDDMARMRLAKGELEAALTAAEAELAIWEDMGPLQFPRQVFAEITRSRVLVAMGREDEARAALTQRLDAFVVELEPDNRHTERLRAELAGLP